MFTVARMFSASNVTALCSNCSINRYICTPTASIPRRRNWKVGNYPAPQSLIGSEEPIDLTEEIVESRLATTALDRRPSGRRTPLEHAAHKASLKKAFPEGWCPPHKLSRAAMDGLRELHLFDPELFTTPLLAEKFRVSPEAVRRILKSKWTPTREQRIRYAQRERRHREGRLVESRLEEIREVLELEQVQDVKENRSQGNDHRGRRVRGVDNRDNLFFS